MHSASLLTLTSRLLRRSTCPLLLLGASIGLLPQKAFSQSLLYQFQVPSGGFDGAGNLLNYSDSVNGSWTLQYDSLNRLLGGTSSTGPYSGLTLQESYDSYGNRWAQNASQAQGSTPTVAVGSTWAQYNMVNNQITKSSSAINAMPYDAAGKVQSDDNYIYAYDGEDRLCAVRRLYDNTITQYIYDAEGRRTGKVSLPGTNTPLTCFVPGSAAVPSTNYLYDPEGHQMTEIDGSGKWQRTHVYSGGALLATYDQQGLHYAVADPLGSVRMHVGAATGAVEETVSNLPFGELPPNQPTYEPTDLHFTGKEHDTESSLDYFGARYYGSSIGRFMSPDDGSDQTPGDPQSLNLYSYARNNPAANIDPTGNDCVTQTRTSSSTETISVNAGNCSGSIGDGQSQTYVNGTVTGISVNGGNSLDIGYDSYDGQSSGVTNTASAPTPDSPGLAYGYGNNAQGYQMLGAASRAVTTGTTVYTGILAAGACAAYCPEAAAAALLKLRMFTGLIPAVPSAILKLQKLGVSLARAREIVQTEQGFIDNDNGGMFGTGKNVNYIVSEGGKMIRVTTDAAGTKIISAGQVAVNFVNRGIASGRLTPR